MRTGSRLPPVSEGFHATVYPIKGDTIQPSVVHGNQVFSMSSTQDTYFTPIPEGLPINAEPRTEHDAESKAWQWGEMVQGAAPGPLPKRVRVHRTEPDAEQYVDKNGRFMGARVSPSQKIKDTTWAPPPEYYQTVDQTLPHINWGQFGASNYTVHSTMDTYVEHRPDRGMASQTDRDEMSPSLAPWLLDEVKASPSMKEWRASSPRPQRGQQELGL